MKKALLLVLALSFGLTATVSFAGGGKPKDDFPQPEGSQPQAQK